MMRYEKKRLNYRLFGMISLLAVFVFPTFFCSAPDNTNIEDEEVNVFTYKGEDGVVQKLKHSSDETITAVVNKEGVQKVFKHNPNIRNIIVQLEDPPIIKYVKKGETISPQLLTTITNQLQAAHQQLKQEITDIERRIGLPPGEPPTTIKREFYYVFNGLTLKTGRRVIKEIKALPYVTEVFPDVEVKASLADSVPLINADDVWNMGYTGAGITVGILDTGIDYTHPDLGGGFGPGFKVTGGYDFVNNDNDPMDDHYHGTHVAGIVAADGTLKGVAPDANLYALKVLDESGGGYESDIIAGIERACDPDQNPQTNDALDVINLSLGGPGDPDDPMSQAIDNASAAGVICVVAAGNNGWYYFTTISSPGCAREAITVGAADKNSNMASFSSKGPSDKIYAIKPDLVAPGVNINSTAPSNSSQELNGTSMAAPHVAGACALLLERYPNRSPRDIKSNLMASTVDLRQGVFVQGCGMLDVLAAVQLKSIVSPASISLGWNNPELATFSKTETLQVTNTARWSKNYSVSITLPGGPGGIYPQPGITAAISPSSFTLASNATRDLTFTITVDNSRVPNGTQEPGSYEGKVVIQAGIQTIKVPFAFIKLPKLEIEFDEDPYLYVVHNRLDQAWPGYLLGINYFSKLLPEGTYDLMLLYADDVTRLVKEEINLVNNVYLVINKSEAIYTTDITTVDENGAAINPTLNDSEFEALIHTSGTGFITAGTLRSPFYLSPVSTEYNWEWSTQFFINSYEKLYSFNCYSNGFNSDFTYRNQQEDLKQVDYKYHVEPGVNEISLETWIGRIDGFLSFGSYYWNRQLSYPFTQKAYYMRLPYPDFYFGGHKDYVYEYVNNSIGNLLYVTPSITVETQPPLGFDFIRGYLVLDDSHTPIFQTTSGYIDPGLSPYWFVKFEIYEQRINFDSPIGGMFWPYLTQTGDVRPQTDLTYQLYKDGIWIKEGSMYDSIPLVTPGAYTLKVPYTDYYVRGLQGEALMSASFDTEAQDKNPPYMTHFNILCEGRPTNEIKPGKASTIKFKLYDDNQLAQVSLYYRTNLRWIILPLTVSGHQYSAQIPQFPIRTFVSLRVVANDISGNKLTFKLAPAFFIKPIPLNPSRAKR